MSNIYQKISELLHNQETFALATIVNYKGSVPRRVAKMIVTKDLKTYGTIGGGCVEGQVAEEAALMLRGNQRCCYKVIRSGGRRIRGSRHELRRQD